MGGEPRARLDPHPVPRAPGRRPGELENGGKPLAVVCSAGNRSSIAASLLKRAGLEGVEHVADGGVEDLEKEGIELVEGK